MTNTTTHALRPDTVKVGDGVTEQLWSDRIAGTVTWVSASGKTFRWTHDKATANGPIHDREQYDYSYESVPEMKWTDPMGQVQSNVRTARWSERRHCYLSGGRPLSAGRHAFWDPSF